MRILTWSPFYPPDVGGIEALLARVLPRMVARGHSCSVIAGSGPAAQSDHSRLDGVDVYRYDFRRAIEDRDLKLTMQITRDITQLKADVKPDVCNVHGLFPSIFFFLRTIHVARSPSVVTLHNDYGTIGLRTGSGTALDGVIAAADFVTGVSHRALESLSSVIDEHKKGSAVIYNGIDVEGRSQAHAGNSQHHIVSVCRLVPQKGLDVLLDALPRVVEAFPDLTLTIAGDGYLREGLEQQAIANGVGKNVVFAGALSPEAVDTLLASSSLFVLPSRFEGLPVSAVEASAASLPIVATRAGGTPEFVVHEETGLLVEPGDVVALADAIISILSDHYLADRLGKAGRRRTAEKFSLDQTVDQYLDVYRRLLGTNMVSDSGVPTA